MVGELGMSETLGPLVFDNVGRDGRPTTLSGDTVRTIDAEVRKLVDDAYGRARTVLEQARPALDAIAEALLERETLTAADLTVLVEEAGGLQPPKRQARSGKKAARTRGGSG